MTLTRFDGSGREPLRVGLDVSFSAAARPAGVARYGEELIEHLTELAEEAAAMRITLLYRLSRISCLRELLRPRGVWRRRGFTDSLADWQLGAFDVVHGLDGRTPRCSRPTVATVHDLFSAQRDDLAREGFRRKKLETYSRTAAEATRIIVPTGAVGAELVDRFPAAAGRVRPIHHGVAEAFFSVSDKRVDACRSRFGLERPYLLFVGRLSIRKNVIRLVRAFSRLAGDYPDLELVLAGEPSNGLEALGHELAVSTVSARVRRTGFVDSDLLPGLFAGAEALVFATLREGFGLPILEALATGTRVVAADQAVPREVGGDAVTYVDPEDVDAIEAGMRAVLEESAEDAGARISQGISRARGFTWRRCAEKTLGVYREVVEEA